MTDVFKGIITADGKKRQLPYGSVLKTPISDETLSIQGAFADAKAVGDKFKEVNAETDSLKEDIGNLSSSKISKFYATNNGENHLADSDNGKIADMMVYGRSEQKSTTGAQLINTFEFKAINGVLTIDEDGVVTLTNNTIDDVSGIQFDLSTLENSQYTFKNYSDVGYYVMLDNVDYSHFIQPNNSFTFTKTDFLKIIGSNIQTGKSANFKCMLEKGSEVHAYEPYTGGQPSPSPDYPQEIKSVVNPTVKVCGKNLFDSKKFPIILNRGLDTNTGHIYQSTSGKYCATEKYIPFPYSGKKISFNASMSLCAYDQDYKFISSVNKNNGQVPSGTMYVRFDIKIEDKDKVQIELSENTTTYEPYHEQTVTLPYTLNAIPVSSGGNVTIDGQQYIADYVDAEHGKLVKMVDSSKLDNTQSIVNKTEWLLAEPQETDLTTEEITAFKALATYYPVTNISINSEQLDGYTVFNYPISMKNGWDYVKQQLNDNRDYIYDMDIQSAEAYVNSEYAVALTELEV